MFAIAVILAAVLVSTLLLSVTVRRLSNASEGLKSLKFVPAIRVSEDLRQASDELTAKLDERIKG
ncbi:unannotated protein [freshwater metagenome]|uniref:Unannotated protein n=1 Tax=freshwater metagenome TaxID=449393 RepID=A0A6J7GJT1_9ZZZZ|nr:hypothetical protein [Actinomycetota bacterium]MSY78314.1 hypothetical protein [Actinomycetota bacterium]